MRHGATILWAVLATVAGTGLFLLKYQVQAEEQRLGHLRKEIVQTEEEIHVLKAEWSYLNEPTRLRDLAERNLGMHPLKVSQITSIDSIPMAEKRPDAPDQAPGPLPEQPLTNGPMANGPMAEAAPVAPKTVSASPAAKPVMPRPAEPQTPVRSFDVKAEEPVKARPAVRTVPAAVKAPAKPAAKAELKTAALVHKPEARKAETGKLVAKAEPKTKTAGKTVQVARAATPAPQPAAKSSYPSIYPTYAAYPAASAPAATPARAAASDNVMVITSPALSGR